MKKVKLLKQIEQLKIAGDEMAKLLEQRGRFPTTAARQEAVNNWKLVKFEDGATA